MTLRALSRFVWLGLAMVCGVPALAAPQPPNVVMIISDDQGFGDFSFMGDGGRRDVTADDIRRGLRLFWMADVLLMVGLGVVGFVLTA